MTTSSYRANHQAAESQNWGTTAAASPASGLPFGMAAVHDALDEFPSEVEEAADELWDPAALPQSFCAEAPPPADGVAPWEALEVAATAGNDYNWEPPAPPMWLKAMHKLQEVMASVTTGAAAQLTNTSTVIGTALRKADLQLRATSLQRRTETLLWAKRHRFLIRVQTVPAVSPLYVALALTMTSVLLFGLALWPSSVPLLPASPRDQTWANFAVPIQAAEVRSQLPVQVAAVRAVGDRVAAKATSMPNRRDAMRRVQQTLNRYRDALSILDARAVKEVWPSADERATRDQFAAVSDQNVEFDSCRISVRESTAAAVCRGTISYVPAARSARRRTEPRRWQFTLAHQDNGWRITRVVAASTN